MKVEAVKSNGVNKKLKDLTHEKCDLRMESLQDGSSPPEHFLKLAGLEGSLNCQYSVALRRGREWS